MENSNKPQQSGPPKSPTRLLSETQIKKYRATKLPKGLRFLYRQAQSRLSDILIRKQKRRGYPPAYYVFLRDFESTDWNRYHIRGPLTRDNLYKILKMIRDAE